MSFSIRRLLGNALYTLPPLHNLRAHNLRLTRRVARLRTSLTRVTEQRAAARRRDQLARDTMRLRMETLERDLQDRTAALRLLQAVHLKPGEMLAPSLGHRVVALKAGTPTPDAVARDRAWREACPPYAAAARSVSSGVPPAGTRQVTIGGLTWCMPSDAATPGSLSHRIVDRGWLPLDDVARVRRLVIGGGMLDIGANIGTTAIPRVLLGDFTVVYAAEPDPDNFACLVSNIAVNGLTGRIIPDPVALSSQTAPLRLRRSTHIGTHHLLADDEKAHVPFVEVQGYTVDDWLTRLGVTPRDLSFIKIDAQGWDGHVMRGASTLLAAPHLVWQVEFSPVMMNKTGMGLREFAALTAAHFTHVRLMAGDESEQPVSAVATIGAGLEPTGSYTNLLLYTRRD